MAENTIDYSGLTTKASMLLTDLMALSDKDGVLYKKELQSFVNFFSTTSGVAFKGSISVGTYPSKDAGWYFASEVGDYIMGSTTLTVSSQNLGIIIVPSAINDSNLVSIPISINIDNALDANSTNAVENGVVTDAIKKPTIDYIAFSNYTTANKNLIDVSDTTKTYVVFDSDLGRLENYKDGAWKAVSDEEALALKADKTEVDKKLNKKTTGQAKIQDDSESFIFVDGEGNPFGEIGVDGTKATNFQVIDPVTKDVVANINKVFIAQLLAGSDVDLANIKLDYKQDGFYFTAPHPTDDKLVVPFAKITAHGIQAVKFFNKNGDEITGAKKLEGEFVVSLGDSHSTAWLNAFCEYTGATWSQELQTYIKDNQYIYEGYGRLQGIAKALKQYLIDNPETVVNRIFIENVHYTVGSGTIDSVPEIFENVETFGTTYNSYQDFADNRSVDKNAFIDSLTPRLRTAIKFNYNSSEATLQFSSVGNLNEGTITLTIDGNDFPVNISEGATLIEAVTLLNDWQFDTYLTDWSNSSTKGSTRTDGTIVLKYIGTTNAVLPTITFDDGGTGMVLDSSVLGTAVAFNYDYFGSNDLSEWQDYSKWYATNGKSFYPRMKGLMEYLQQNFPEIPLVIWTAQYLNVSDVPADASSFQKETSAGSGEYIIDIDAYFNDSKVANYMLAKKGFEEISKRYNVEFLDMDSNCGITIHNMFSGDFYRKNDLHPLPKGYDIWGITNGKLIKK
jgi:hypothetical protein